MASRRYGFHSGVMKCQDARVQGDLYVTDDLVFSDVSAGQLGVTGGIDMSSTTSAIGITMTGGTFSTAAIEIGTSSSKQAFTADTTRAISIYTTCSDTDGANTAKALYVHSTYTGLGQVARAAEFVLYPTVKLGGWANALKGYTDFSGDADGGSTGLVSAICAEINMPNGACNGALYPLEIEWVGSASTAFGVPGAGSQSGFIYIAASGTVTDLDDDGCFMSVNGLTAGSGHMLSATSQTLFVDISQGTSRYMVLSQLEDGLGLGASGSAMDLGSTATNKAVAIYTTSSSTTAGTSVEPFYFESTMTGAGGVGGRAKFKLSVEAALGGWANAIKGETTFAAAGSVTGLGSVFCGDLTLSTGTSGGSYAVFEGNIIAGASASTGTQTVFFQLNADGADEDTVDSNAFLFGFGDALDAASGKFIDTDKTAEAAYGGIRVKIDGVGTKYIRLYDAA